MKLRAFFLLFLCLMSESIVFGGTMMSVQVKKGAVRESPSFLARTLTLLDYGDHVTPLNKKGDWVEIQSTKKKGWIHSSALSDKEVVLAVGPMKAQKDVSNNEVVMAGKGFNSKVESEYRHQNPTMRFDLVDAIEKYTIQLQAQHAFAVDGKLKY